MARRWIDRPFGSIPLPAVWFNLTLLALALPAHAQVTANLRLEQVNGGCFVDDEEDIFSGDPERYFRLGIFDSTAFGVLAACASSCTADATPATQDGSVVDRCSYSTGCGLFDFADLTLSKIIPSQSGAYFYIGLWDDDVPVSSDDSLGDHWVFSSGPVVSSAPANNNNSPYYADNPIATVCGHNVEGLGSSGNYNPRYSIWFTDQTPPSAASNVRLSDDGQFPFWDNDSLLNFTWIASSDPDSGIVSHLIDLYSAEDGFLCSSAPAAAGSASICAGACTCAATPVHGRIYSFRAGGRNGSHPDIDNPATTMSSYIQVGVDLVNPVTAITGPPAGGWKNAAFGVSFSDTDSGAGVDPTLCRWGAVSSAVVTLSGASRTCSSSVTVSVGPAADCRHEGTNTCQINGMSADLARRGSLQVQRAFSIDWTADTTAGLGALTQAGGTTLAAAIWQTDNTPYFSWTAATSTAPIAGYSYALDVTPDCVTDTASLFHQVPPATIGDGMHVFGVRAVDAAGNCGPVSTFALYVDTVAESLADLQAYTEPGGATIPAMDWQSDNDPHFEWTAPASTSPIEGYSFALDVVPDCVPETTSPSYSFAADSIADGMHLFRVRTIDAAGNCGPEAVFDIWVYQSQGMSPGRIPGTLDVHPDAIDPDLLELVWEPSCGVLASDYAVYEGTLGAWYSHAPVACTTTGMETIAILPGAGNRYFLVVPLSLSEEGSYGTATGGGERPAGGTSCLPQAPPTPCP